MVLKAIFEYLLFIEESGVDQIRENLKDFKLHEDYDMDIGNLSDFMALYPPKDILRGTGLFEFDELEISAVIEALNQPKFNLMILSGGEKFDKHEPLSDFKYSEIGGFSFNFLDL
jgi:hypothetical protein